MGPTPGAGLVGLAGVLFNFLHRTQWADAKEPQSAAPGWPPAASVTFGAAHRRPALHAPPELEHLDPHSSDRVKMQMGYFGYEWTRVIITNNNN